ncbi:5-methyltetrahydropteroyltriglutamate--homocysteine S-methyltransferase [Candidatus Portiera aleyrodidarum]|uniref:5-methyltetrahydropteroyltriglutamate--homocysteine methyltransferase n=1 Tax=Candidatus Portiera aleyrodidarum MED (Bemisia tabaci) TaxID=1163752 RepID=A0AAU8RQU4_9GAMM|nr:5-methyltetrahydropteroyltriglutamate--homocysteine S-methyltransferase [Candidatus Portiera aleyrodidarum]AFS18894.1 5-methyltetrahydropteroyltriglutamate--homocysteine methyltransferase [Candidatus Portiera aleyrodidarum BT-QVLC]AJF24107.1 5-methyltetrahydropteroyltriglutamate--homocysteine methyltransferase [Candidatus Portiera aleyrodidarum MED (Bemisia tabaci)]
MIKTHILGYPRIGNNRELKKALEAFWKKDINLKTLEKIGKKIREKNWITQYKTGLSYVNVGDFSYYDQVLNITAMIGAIPKRFNIRENSMINITTLFKMARGCTSKGKPISACEMTKYFDTNYHYIVPELEIHNKFFISNHTIFNEVKDCQKLGLNPKVVLMGPITYLWLAKSYINKLNFLPSLINIYSKILKKLEKQNVEWVQIDEPVLVVELPKLWKDSFEIAYKKLSKTIKKLKIMIATYFGGLGKNIDLVLSLPIHNIHIDIIRTPKNDLELILNKFPTDKLLSIGIINGRNIWKSNLKDILNKATKINNIIKTRMWISSSCSLMHIPISLSKEKKINRTILNWLSFARQKLDEIVILSKLLTSYSVGENEIKYIQDNTKAIESRKLCNIVSSHSVKERIKQLTNNYLQRNHSYYTRKKIQQKQIKLPLFPTTTIGSFPQTNTIRLARRTLKLGKINIEAYEQIMRYQILFITAKQNFYDLDMFVHGEPERNDMVEYFGENLNGFVFTTNGWVQSYGSRCVKPPIIYGDIKRNKPITVRWIKYAQNNSFKPVKGMLTGPVTILQWSFERDDQPKETTCKQIALALRDEVKDLEQSGIKAIQIDEPALREGLPLKKKDYKYYLNWAISCFKIASSIVSDETQIHTHMCYSQFNDIIAYISEMDADVITIETARSNMALLKAFKAFEYKNEIGPGIYDIHTTNIPSVNYMIYLIKKAAKSISIDRIWINPDCGLKTRKWDEVDYSLKNMVKAAYKLRIYLNKN